MTQDLQARLLATVGGRDAFAGSFANRTFRDLNRRVEMELEGAEGEIGRAFAAIDKAAAEHGAAAAIAAELKAEIEARYVRAWAAYQHAGARTANWMVTGPARFPVERNRKRMDTEHKRLGEMLEISKGAGAWAAKRFRRASAAELGPVGIAERELEDARANLAKRERRQAMMKAANAELRKHKALEPEARAAAVAEAMERAGYAEISAHVARCLLEPAYPGAALGFERFQLTNNGAEIRRLAGRVAELERKAAAIAAAPAAETVDLAELEGPRIIENTAEDRLQIFFPDKPDAATRAKLKGRGFRWAPSQGAWQRQLTANAREAARAVLAA